jgi:glycosyltransferase involved in cell wall biosynthesis
MRIPGRTRIPQEAALLAARLRRPEIAIAHEFQTGPYGGSNQFLVALRGELRRRGLRVEANAVTRTTRACLLNAFLFDADRLRRSLHPGCRVVHRIDGPVGTYRGADDGTDLRLAELNAELAHATIFQSQYSADAHRALGLEFREPTVIHNAVDPAIFHPPERRAPSARIRIVTAGWSPHPNKGGAVYRWLDDHLDRSKYEFTLVGRTDQPLRHARTIPPVRSRELAGILRESDVFLTASLHESCSNAVLEALACGLPVLYADSGSHAELVGDAGLPFRDPEELPGLLDRLAGELEQRRSAIRSPRLADVADRYLAVMGFV